ncbi:uncharacterized protein PV07_11834 [Cladophialophora immunda]|uniref:Uncharacterized protein n=1 Tax=Cladophialophora immunda TaxID=569365 RepID=A0A0D2BZA2_9EURO|nr:uncharacterized protein PV07_11834 [Cladophialophora immunda]KIW23650.1 hypothetical protein PV07_11834 [Cladophialophora immunda]
MHFLHNGGMFGSCAFTSHRTVLRCTVFALDFRLFSDLFGQLRQHGRKDGGYSPSLRCEGRDPLCSFHAWERRPALLLLRCHLNHWSITLCSPRQNGRQPPGPGLDVGYHIPSTLPCA